MRIIAFVTAADPVRRIDALPGEGVEFPILSYLSPLMKNYLRYNRGVNMDAKFSR